MPFVPEGLSKVAEFFALAAFEFVFLEFGFVPWQRMNLISFEAPGWMGWKGTCKPLRLHLHAIFHIVTTMSPYCYVVFMTYHRCLILKREAEHRLGIGLAYVHVKEIAP